MCVFDRRVVSHETYHHKRFGDQFFLLGLGCVCVCVQTLSLCFLFFLSLSSRVEVFVCVCLCVCFFLLLRAIHTLSQQHKNKRLSVSGITWFTLFHPQPKKKTNLFFFSCLVCVVCVVCVLCLCLCRVPPSLPIYRVFSLSFSFYVLILIIINSQFLLYISSSEPRRPRPTTTFDQFTNCILICLLWTNCNNSFD